MTVRLLMAARVTRIAELSSRVRAIAVRPVHRERFPGFAGGEHVQLQHSSGVRRDYSLISSPSDLSGYEIAVRRDPGGRGGSVLFHDKLRVGETVFVSYPQPGMSLAADADRHVFVAGGIGVTSILGLLHAMPPGASGVVHYCVRDDEDAVLLGRLPATGLEVRLHRSARGERLDLGELIAGLSAGSVLYHCGPERMTRQVEQLTGHLPDGRVRSERFAAVTAQGERLGDPFTARLAIAQRTIAVGERQSLLRALLAAGVPLEYSCESGICGTCVLEATSGQVEHHDLCLTREQRQAGFMTACVSRGKGEIELFF